MLFTFSCSLSCALPTGVTRHLHHLPARPRNTTTPPTATTNRDNEYARAHPPNRLDSLLTALAATRNRGYKTRLYLSHPEPDIATVRKSVTRFIPPSPPPPPPCPPIEAPAPPPPPPPPVCPEPLPPPPPPPAEPEPEPDPIDVIAVDVDPSPPKKPKKKKSRSKSRSKSRDRDYEHDYERVVERDHYIPYPVRAEPQYETFRYVDAPRRWSPPQREPEPQRRPLMLEDEHQIRIRMRDQERERESSRDWDCYSRR